MSADGARSIPRVEADAIEVFVTAEALETPGPTSYHEREGCYNAADAVPWTAAIEAGATPCGRCCESFEVVQR